MKKILLSVFIISAMNASAQNVGIGNTSPAEKLDVTGNVKANSFMYASPKTFYYAIPDGAFTARTSTETVQKTYGLGGAYISDGGSYGLVAPVYLPQNARIVSVKVDFYDASATQDLIFYFVRQFTQSFSFDATVSSTGSGGLNTQTISINTSLLIDNSINAYEVFVAPTTGNWNTPDLAIRRVIFGYTLDEAQ